MRRPSKKQISRTLVAMASFLFVVVIAFPILSTTPRRADSQPALPQLQDIASAINQNRQKITNLKLRSMTVTALSPDYLGPVPDGANKPLIVHGKRVLINRDLVLLDGDNRFVDENTTEIGSNVILTRSQKYWFDAGRGKTTTQIESNQFLDSKGQVQDVTSAAYDSRDLSLPLGAVDTLQIRLKGLSHEASYGATARVVGYEIFHGLNCIRVEWGQKDKPPSWGYQLVCPNRDWKVICEEAYNAEGFKEFKTLYQKTVVEQLQKRNNAWIPYSTYQETKKIGFKGEESICQEKFKVVDFAADEVNADLLFNPVLSPGTIFMEEGIAAGPAKVIGGSISGLITQVQKGDFSFLKEEIGDLSKP